MQQHLSPAGWKRRAQARGARAGYRWEDCSIPHGLLRMGKRSTSASVVYLHAAHVNHDSHNPQAALRALCPSCQLKYDRRTKRKRAGARRQGYQVVRTTRLLIEIQGAGLHISQEGDRFAWQVGASKRPPGRHQQCAAVPGEGTGGGGTRLRQQTTISWTAISQVENTVAWAAPSNPEPLLDVNWNRFPWERKEVQL